MTYKVQVNDEVRDATPDEAAQIENAQKAVADYEAAIAAQEAAKKSARAKLAALGLTLNELTALVGA